MIEEGYIQDIPELYYTGTQLSSAIDYSSTAFQQDVDQSLELDEPAFQSPRDDELWATSFSPFANPFIQDLSSLDDIQTVRRTDSGLNALARPFIPASQQSARITNSTIPARNQFLQQQLTPIRTNFGAYQTPPSYSAPAYQHDAYPSDMSPLLTVTDAMHRTQIHPGSDYQWDLSLAPAQQVDAWVDTSAYGGQLSANYMDSAYLTPTTPGSHSGSISGRSRSRSIASASSYHCEHHGCGKDFRTKTEYSHHRRNHGERKHACPQCQGRFVFRKDLNRHIKTHNPNRREFFCPVVRCPWAERGFQRKDHYDRHMKTHAPRSTGIITPVSSSAPMSRCASGR